KALPTFAVSTAFPAMAGMTSAGIEINLVMVLHGEQSFRIHSTIPTKGKLTTKGTVASVYDKGKGALLHVATETVDESGKLIFENTSGVFVRGAGRFGGGGAGAGRGEHPAGARAGEDCRDADAADPGDDLSPLGRPEPSAHRSGLR